MIPNCVFLHPLIQLFDLLRWTANSLDDWLAISQLVVADGQQRRKHNTNVLESSKFNHRAEIIFNGLQRCWSSVACQIICPGENDYHPGLQVDHITAKTNQHLRCRLTADAAIDVGLSGKESTVVGIVPGIGDRVAP